MQNKKLLLPFLLLAILITFFSSKAIIGTKPTKNFYSKNFHSESENSLSLKRLADSAFESQAFEEAAIYYKKYLAISPEDNLYRGRYASSLIFLGDSEAALNELDKVLIEDPGNFSALAYKAIALAEANKKEEALKVAEQAIPLAPDDMGRERFQAFINSLSNKAEQGFQELENYLKSNSITASKYMKYEAASKTLTLYFQDFPISSMPEFAKNKFFQKIKSTLSKDIEKIIFIDTATNTPMEEVSLTKPPTS